MGIKQINCQGTKPCSVFIADEMSWRYMILLVQGPYWFKGKILNSPKGYKSFYAAHTAVVIAHQSIEIQLCPKFSEEDFSICLIQVEKGKTAFLLSSYDDILKSPTGEKLSQLKDEILSLNKKGLNSPWGLGPI